MCGFDKIIERKKMGQASTCTTLVRRTHSVSVWLFTCDLLTARKIWNINNRILKNDHNNNTTLHSSGDSRQTDYQTV